MKIDDTLVYLQLERDTKKKFVSINEKGTDTVKTTMGFAYI